MSKILQLSNMEGGFEYILVANDLHLKSLFKQALKEYLEENNLQILPRAPQETKPDDSENDKPVIPLCKRRKKSHTFKEAAKLLEIDPVKLDFILEIRDYKIKDRNKITSPQLIK